MSNNMIEKSIRIAAPAAKVWDALILDEYTRIWYAAFSEGSHAVTDWKLGSKAIFTDNSNCGIVGRITANEPCRLLSIVYEGVMTDGQEDYSSEGAQQVKGGKEIYTLSEEGNTTTLSVQQDISESYLDFMNAAWDNALNKIKEIAENNL